VPYNHVSGWNYSSGRVSYNPKLNIPVKVTIKYRGI